MTNVAQFFLGYNADIDGGDNNGWTPLMHVIKDKKVDKVKLLLDGKADVKRTNKEGNPFQAFLLNGQVLLPFSTGILAPEKRNAKS